MAYDYNKIARACHFAFGSYDMFRHLSYRIKMSYPEISEFIYGYTKERIHPTTIRKHMIKKLGLKPRPRGGANFKGKKSTNK